jgi:hypothetical protein
MRSPLADYWNIGGSTVISNFSKIGDGALRVFDLHARRKLANAVLRSFSLAVSPASLVNRQQFVGRRMIRAAGEVRLDLEGKIHELPLPLRRPARHPIQNRLYLVFCHNADFNKPKSAAPAQVQRVTDTDRPSPDIA